MEDEDWIVEPTPAIKFDLFNLVVLPVVMLSDIAESISTTLSDLEQALQCHATWRSERRELKSSVIKDIERL